LSEHSLVTIQINPSKLPIWVGESELQLGVSPDSQTLTELSNAQERLVHLLFHPTPDKQLTLLGDSVGLDEVETSEFVKRLKPSLLTAEGTEDHATVELRFAELMRIAFDTDRVAEDILALRTKTAVVIEELNRTGLLLIRALSEMGFRNFFTSDYEKVAKSDLGELGYPIEAVGVSRVTAAREALGVFGTLKLETAKQVRELRVLSSNHSISPSRYRELTQPHLVIEYGVEAIEVSSVVTPKQTPCIGCRDLWRSEADPNWCNRTIQLALRKDHLDDAAALLVAISLAAKNICNFIDGQSTGTSFEVRLKTRTFREIGHQNHPACRCVQLKAENL
jgi:hypothetical protein